ncbi:MAG: DUF4835 family protein [Bacteroidota bacterium]
MRSLIIALFCLFQLSSSAQELNAIVSIATPQLQTTDPRVFQTLEKAIQEFLNNNRWTNDIYEFEERIKISININIREELGGDSYTADFFIQATRPIYGSSQSTAVLEHKDSDFAFTYREFDPLEYSDNQFNNNLTSFLAFYAYVALGLDYDSFSPLGGEVYWQKANDIMTNIPTSLNAALQNGWRSLDSQRNRFWILETMLSPRTGGIRQGIYEYHRLGLDIMGEDHNEARKAIYSSIEKMRDANKNYPNAMAIQMFVNAKRDEIIEIFKGGTSNEKREVYAMMIRLDAANASAYRVIRN